MGGGRRKLIPEAIGAPKFDRGAFGKLLYKTFHYTKEELKEVHDNPSSTILEVWLAAIVVKGVQRGCPLRLEALLNRAIGPVPKLIDATIEETQAPYYPSPDIQKLPDEELIKLVTAHLEEDKNAHIRE